MATITRLDYYINGTHDANGCECLFYLTTHRNHNVGLKLYATQAEGTLARARQKLAAEHKLAPRVFGGVIRAKIEGHERTWYGYRTEICPSLSSSSGRRDGLDALKSGLWEIFGARVEDLHIDNWGHMADGRAVAIDLGPVSAGHFVAPILSRREDDTSAPGCATCGESECGGCSRDATY